MLGCSSTGARLLMVSNITTAWILPLPLPCRFSHSVRHHRVSPCAHEHRHVRCRQVYIHTHCMPTRTSMRLIEILVSTCPKVRMRTIPTLLSCRLPRLPTARLPENDSTLAPLTTCTRFGSFAPKGPPPINPSSSTKPSSSPHHCRGSMYKA